MLTARRQAIGGTGTCTPLDTRFCRLLQSHEGAVHMQITRIGIDLAKNVFQVHGADAADKVVMKRGLRRSQMLAFFEKLPPCLIGMEACATAHYWGRELTALGHTVRLMPPSYVKPYVKRGRSCTTASDCDADWVARPSASTRIIRPIQPAIGWK